MPLHWGGAAAAAAAGRRWLQWLSPMNVKDKECSRTPPPSGPALYQQGVSSLVGALFPRRCCRSQWVYPGGWPMGSSGQLLLRLAVGADADQLLSYRVARVEVRVCDLPPPLPLPSPPPLSPLPSPLPTLARVARVALLTCCFAVLAFFAAISTAAWLGGRPLFSPFAPPRDLPRSCSAACPVCTPSRGPTSGQPPRQRLPPHGPSR